MKAKAIALIVMLVAIGSNLAYGNPTGFMFPLEEETSIDDIPFDTHSVFLTVIKGDSTFLNVFEMDEEKPVDDIPFDTRQVAETALEDSKKQGSDCGFWLAEEENVADIPFDTYKVYKQMTCDWEEIICPGYSRLINSFHMAPEKPVDDIPFDTFRVICITAK